MRRRAPVLLLLALLAGPVSAAEPGDPGLDPDRVVATVGNHLILMREVLKLVGPGLATEPDPVRRQEKVELQILALVRTDLEAQAAKRLGITISDREVDEQVRKEAENLQGLQRSLDSVLAEQGWTLEEFREFTRDRILLERFQAAMLGMDRLRSLKARPVEDSFVRPKEIQDHYRGNLEKFRRPAEARLRWIFVKAVSFLRPGLEMVEARRQAQIQAEGIRARIGKGEDFTALAREFSEDAAREKGGDQGFKGREQLPELVRGWAFSAEPGEVTDVLETPAGYLIARLEERRPERILPFEEVQDSIKMTLRRARQDIILARIRLHLVEEADITPERFRNLLRRQLVRQLQER